MGESLGVGSLRARQMLISAGGTAHTQVLPSPASRSGVAIDGPPTKSSRMCRLSKICGSHATQEHGLDSIFRGGEGGLPSELTCTGGRP